MYYQKLKYRFNTLLLKFTQDFKRINDMYVEIYCNICYFLCNIKYEDYLNFLNKIKNEIQIQFILLQSNLGL